MKVITTLAGEEKKTVDDIFNSEDAARKGAFDLSKKASEYSKMAWETIREMCPDADNKKAILKYDKESGEVSWLYDVQSK